MNRLEQFTQNTLRTGAVATAATTVAIAASGSAENDNPLSPINAVSHIAWGERAAAQDDASLKYTLTGAVLNATAVVGWAGVYELLFGRAADRRQIGRAVAGGAAVAALAYVTDYHVVPPRLTPGFEKRLSNRSLLKVYATLALGLGLGSLLKRSSAN